MKLKPIFKMSVYGQPRGVSIFFLAFLFFGVS